MASDPRNRTPGYRPEDDGTQPPYLYPASRSPVFRSPSRPLIPLKQTLSEISGPIFGSADVRPLDDDLTRQHSGTPLGQRIIVSGRLLDGDGAAIPNSLVEIWQANAA